MVRHEKKGRKSNLRHSEKLPESQYELLLACAHLAYSFVEPHDRPATIYRSSNHSVTFRCQKCSLQWTVTFANLHRVAEARLKKGMSKPSYEAAYDFLESITRLAAENATARKSIVTRQIPRVIRLPDTPGQRSDVAVPIPSGVNS